MDNEQYLTEVREVFKNDSTLFGKVWRYNNEGKSPDEMAKELRHPNSKTVNSRLKFIQYIERDVTPTSLPAAILHGDRLRRFIKRDHDRHLSKNAIQIFEKRMEECARRVANLQAIEDEDAKVEKETNQAEKAGIVGIYVYTYPHYYRYPIVPETDDSEARTYLKVGMSGKDVEKRVMQQTTGMPEPPMLLQIWVVGGRDLKKIETKIHNYLHEIGHSGENPKREWFLTNEQSVTSTANRLGLKLHYERNPEMDD